MENGDWKYYLKLCGQMEGIEDSILDLRTRLAKVKTELNRVYQTSEHPEIKYLRGEDIETAKKLTIDLDKNLKNWPRTRKSVKRDRNERLAFEDPNIDKNES